MGQVMAQVTTHGMGPPFHFLSIYPTVLPPRLLFPLLQPTNATYDATLRIPDRRPVHVTQPRLVSST